MNEPHRSRGYRELCADESLLIDLVKEAGKQMEGTVDDVSVLPGVDQRALAIARTHLQTGVMWLIRAIELPENP